MHMQTHTHTYKLPCSWLKASQHIFLSIICFFLVIMSLYVSFWVYFSCFSYRTSAFDTLGILITPEIFKSEVVMRRHSCFFSPRRYVSSAFLLSAVRRGLEDCAALLQLKSSSSVLSCVHEDSQTINGSFNFYITIDSVWHPHLSPK